MARHQYQLGCVLHVKAKNFIKLSDMLEVSLPCISCKRMQRTVVFYNENELGICTPRRKCNGFPGRIVKREISETTTSLRKTW